MKNKMVGFFVCMVLIVTTVFPVGGMFSLNDSPKAIQDIDVGVDSPIMEDPKLPILEFKNIKGGLLGISVMLTNSGEATAYDISWEIIISEGMLGPINITLFLPFKTKGEISSLAAGEETEISVPIVGIGQSTVAFYCDYTMIIDAARSELDVYVKQEWRDQAFFIWHTFPEDKQPIKKWRTLEEHEYEYIEVDAGEAVMFLLDPPEPETMHNVHVSTSSRGVKFLGACKLENGKGILVENGITKEMVKNGGNWEVELVMYKTINVDVKGSSTVYPIANRCAQVFNDEHEKMFINVHPPVGSDGGIEALGEGLTDIATTSRPVTQSEIEKYPHVDFFGTTIGYFGAAVIISEEIYYEWGVTDLSAQEIRDIYTGAISYWWEVGGPKREIEVHEHEEGSVIWRHFMNRLGLEETIAHFAWGSNSEMKKAVEQADNAIGYVTLNFVGPTTPAIKIDGCYPTEEKIRDGLYLISRPLIMYTDGPPYNGPKAYIEFVISNRGQEIVKDEGFITIG
jgi:phosphate transport system substrate-binding protein